MSLASYIKRLFGITPTKKGAVKLGRASDFKSAVGLLGELRSATDRQIGAHEFEKALLNIRSFIRIGWWSIAGVRFDSGVDKNLHAIGRAMARNTESSSDRTQVLYITSGVLAYGGITQQLVNQLEYHDREHFQIHVYSTEQFPKSDTSSERGDRIRELSNFNEVATPNELLDSANEIADYIVKKKIGCIILLLSPDDAIGLIVPSMFAGIPSIFINASHHVFTGGSFQFDAFVDVTGHYHQESVSSQRNENLVYISLSGRMKLKEGKLIDPRDFRAELALSQDSLLTITVGNVSKNTWGGNNSYLHVIGSTLTKYPHVHHLLLSSGAEQLCEDIMKEYPASAGKVHPISPTTDIISALKGCDIYLNSFPMGGALSTLDAILAGLPVIFISAHEAWFNKPHLTVHDQEGYTSLLSKYISNEQFRTESRIELQKMYNEMLKPSVVVGQYEDLILELQSREMKVPAKKTLLTLEKPRVKGFSKRLDKISVVD